MDEWMEMDGCRWMEIVINFALLLKFIIGEGCSFVVCFLPFRGHGEGAHTREGKVHPWKNHQLMAGPHESK